MQNRASDIWVKELEPVASSKWHIAGQAFRRKLEKKLFDGSKDTQFPWHPRERKVIIWDEQVTVHIRHA